MAPVSWLDLLKTISAVIGWYFWSSAVVFTNRHLLTSGLTAPVSLTLLHMLGSSLFSNSMVMFCGYDRQVLQSSRQTVKTVLLSATFGLSVVCGTAALKFIPVSFNEMIASTTPLFAAVFTFITMRETQGVPRTLALFAIAAGCIVASRGEPLWNTLGFTLALTATATRALRTALGELLMSSEVEKLDSMNLLRYMSTFVCVLLVPVVILLEGPDQLVNVVLEQFKQGNTYFVFWFTFNIISAFSVNLCQLLVTKFVGAVAMQVLGIFKGVCAAILSIFIFHNPVTVGSALGYLVTTAGVFSYTYFRHVHEANKRNAKKVVDINETKISLMDGKQVTNA
mmetsp:Transcript_13331/g.31553  ORF Transcript_13331/g.31553 Transcript_13331/m.31553 type:complete len:339 (+) Transcript_13331:190-1206(+)